jgi:integrase
MLHCIKKGDILTWGQGEAMDHKLEGGNPDVEVARIAQTRPGLRHSSRIKPEPKPRQHGTGSIIKRAGLNNWYIAYYREGRQHFINTKFPNTPENYDAAKAMLERELAKRTLDIRSEALGLKKITYRDLKQHLLEQYEKDGVASLYTKADGTKTVMGLNWLDGYFDNLTLAEMLERLPDYPKYVQNRDDVKEAWKDRVQKEVALLLRTENLPKKVAQDVAKTRADKARDASINRSLSTLRSMYSRYSKSYPKKVGRGDIPWMPRIQDADNVRQGFVSPETYKAILDKMPVNLRPLVEFLHFTGMRSGAAMKLTWGMVDKDYSEILVPAGLMKNREPLTIALDEGLTKTIKESRPKGFVHAHSLLFDSTNFRRVWNEVAASLGLGVLDKESKRYHGLHPHDFRRTAARNLIRAGKSETVAMGVTGHKTNSMFKRYNITAPDEKRDALTAARAYVKNEIEAANGK